MFFKMPKTLKQQISVILPLPSFSMENGCPDGRCSKFLGFFHGENEMISTLKNTLFT